MMTMEERDALVRSVVDRVEARPDIVEGLTRVLCGAYYQIPPDVLHRARHPKLTLVDPPCGEGDHEHRLIVPLAEDGWCLELYRVVPSPRKARGVSLVKRLDVRLEIPVSLSARSPVSGWPYYKNHTDDVTRFLSITERFLTDPDAAFAKSGENCVFCGRRLTDDASRLRGIGPECYGKFGDVMKYLRASSVAAA